jgi:hypothetical protein
VTGRFDPNLLRRIALGSVAAYAIAFVLIMVGFALGSQRAVIGAGFLIGGLAALANLVFRLLVMPPSRNRAPQRRAPSPLLTTSTQGFAIRGVAALVMLWVGVSFLIRSH